MEDHIPFEQRLQVTVLPTLHLITHQNCVVHTTVVNNADTSRTFERYEDCHWSRKFSSSLCICLRRYQPTNLLLPRPLTLLICNVVTCHTSHMTNSSKPNKCCLTLKMFSLFRILRSDVPIFRALMLNLNTTIQFQCRSSESKFNKPWRKPLPTINIVYFHPSMIILLSKEWHFMIRSTVLSKFWPASVSVVLHSVLSNVSSFKPNFQTLVISLTMVPTELTQAESKQLLILQLHRMLNHGPILWMLHLQFFCHICTPPWSSY